MVGAHVVVAAVGEDGAVDEGQVGVVGVVHLELVLQGLWRTTMSNTLERNGV